jgi:hypothetical protein
VEETVYRTVLGDILDDLSSAISIRDEKFQEALEVANELELKVSKLTRLRNWLIEPQASFDDGTCFLDSGPDMNGLDQRGKCHQSKI